ncbi:hypothetical protein SESBI_31669 [Sesbania bispinosa]|nr:hypothetical protein SESBI_31669 [Sesbania bispinosa]
MEREMKKQRESRKIGSNRMRERSPPCPGHNFVWSSCASPHPHCRIPPCRPIRIAPPRAAS